MKSSSISTVSACALFLGGLSLLFAPDVILRYAAPAIPPSGAWLGQLIGAGWLAMGAVNWLSRGSILGGVYGRPVMVGNLAIYFVTAMVLIRVAFVDRARVVLWIGAVLALLVAGLYFWLLVRGPLSSDLPPIR